MNARNLFHCARPISRRAASSASAVIAALGLSACGGGGGGGAGTPTYAVSGSVSGLAGTLVLEDNGSDDLMLSASGELRFATTLADASAYRVTVRTQPAGETCIVGNGTGTIAGADVVNVTVTCTAMPVGSGTLDSGFGNAGKLLAPTGYAQGVVIQGSGKSVILIFGAASVGNSFTLVRYNLDGSPDATFGIGGQTQGNLGGVNVDNESPHALVQQSDGKLVVGGTGSGLIGGLPNREFALARFDAEGHLDASFGSAGRVLASFNNGHSSDLLALALQADGKLVAVGSTPGASNDFNFAVARFRADGSLDPGFGTAGTVVTDFSQSEHDNGAESVAIQADGKIVVAGWNQLGGSGSDVVPALARYTSGGSLDATFGSGGQVSNVGLIDDSGGRATVVIQDDGRIVVSKNVDTGLVDFALSRYNGDGSADTTFGVNGVVKTAVGNSQDIANAMVIQPDGKIIVAGSSQTASNSVFALVRYLPGGSLDPSFGTAGETLTDFGTTLQFCSALALQADGKIVAAGGASDGTPQSALARYAP